MILLDLLDLLISVYFDFYECHAEAKRALKSALQLSQIFDMIISVIFILEIVKGKKI